MDNNDKNLNDLIEEDVDVKTDNEQSLDVDMNNMIKKAINKLKLNGNNLSFNENEAMNAIDKIELTEEEQKLQNEIISCLDSYESVVRVLMTLNDKKINILSNDKMPFMTISSNIVYSAFVMCGLKITKTISDYMGISSDDMDNFTALNEEEDFND